MEDYNKALELIAKYYELSNSSAHDDIAKMYNDEAAGMEKMTAFIFGKGRLEVVHDAMKVYEG